ncbi:MAG: hypothetical protein BAJALOKI1v1_70035 [Promethearchaeota archaeon]|nr:MAG: hypothetical protein BAJALOKI1v1_70035 [Candidatus Lokiarchaeota archaeon]
MLNKNAWESSEWTKRSYQLLKGIKQFPQDSKLIMVIRHSHRYDSNSIRDHPKDLLTPVGHQYAKLFGESLPKDRPIRVYHSIIERCKQTADNIINGYIHSPLSAELMGTLDVLYDIGITQEDFYREAAKYPLDKLVYRWVAGLYPQEMIPPLQEYAMKAARRIWNVLESAPERCIDIHVTHDLILSVLRLGWFGLPFQEWPSYLSGILFSLQKKEKKILLYDFNYLISLEQPFWFQNT